MAKEKPQTHEEVKASYDAAVVARQEAKEALNSFLEEHSLRKNVIHTGKLEDKKAQKAYDKLYDAWSAAREKEQALKDAEKKARPSKERATKYVYPADCTSGIDRKNFRAACRQAAKRAGVDLDTYLSDPEKYDKVEKAPKKAKKEKAEKASKKDKKKGKEAKEGKAGKKKAKKASKEEDAEDDLD
jgi:hypothetical protein